MRYLCRLITPSGGTVLDPFAGTGTTGQAALEESFRTVLIEKEAEYIEDITRRIDNIPANLNDFMQPSDGTQTVPENQQEQVSNDNVVD
jgi:DNA modification methylase